MNVRVFCYFQVILQVAAFCVNTATKALEQISVASSPNVYNYAVRGYDSILTFIHGKHG